jgi:hypothetical protein
MLQVSLSLASKKKSEVKEATVNYGGIKNIIVEERKCRSAENKQTNSS